MSQTESNRQFKTGTGLIAGVLKTISGFLRSEEGGFTQEIGESVNKNLIIGGLAGGLIGAAAALLLAPKPGTELVNDLLHPFSEEIEKRHPIQRKKNSLNTVNKKSVSEAPKPVKQKRRSGSTTAKKTALSRSHPHTSHPTVPEKKTKRRPTPSHTNHGSHSHSHEKPTS